METPVLAPRGADDIPGHHPGGGDHGDHMLFNRLGVLIKTHPYCKKICAICKLQAELLYCVAPRALYLCWKCWGNK